MRKIRRFPRPKKYAYVLTLVCMDMCTPFLIMYFQHELCGQHHCLCGTEEYNLTEFYLVNFVPELFSYCLPLIVTLGYILIT